MDTQHWAPGGHTSQQLAISAPIGATCNGRPAPPEAARSRRKPAPSAPSAPQLTHHARHGKVPTGTERSLNYRGPSTSSKASQRAKPRHAVTRSLSWHALTYKGFRRYFIGSVVSNLGTWLQNTAQALLAYQLTHSVLAIGAVVCAQFSWVLMLGPWAGRVVNRTRSVRRLLISAQFAAAAAAAAMAALQFAGLLTEARLIAGALSIGLAYCFTLPATAVLVPVLVPERKSKLENDREIAAAVALDQASYNIGRCAAPLLAVLVVTRIGFGWAFALNAASFLVFAAALTKAQPCKKLRPNSKAKVMDGFRVVVRNQKLQQLLIIVAAVTITADPVLVLGPALARHFGLPEAWAAYFLSALGTGTILGSFIPKRPPSRVRNAAYPLFLLGAAVAVFALGINRWLSLAAAFAAGVACLRTGSAARALLWDYVPPEKRELQGPAVMAIWAVAWAGSKPLASLVDGVLATFIGAWVAGALHDTWKLPSVQVTGVLLAIPALIPALAALVVTLRLMRPVRLPTSMTDSSHMG